MAKLKDTEINNSLSISGVHNLIPVGGILMWWNSNIPAGYKLCDGQLYTVASEPTLYNAIQNIFGGSQGVNFNVPDFQEKHVLGVNSSYPLNAKKDLVSHYHYGIAHVHAIMNHVHGLNDHKHSVTSHAHNLNSHTHTLSSHTHYIDFHTHSLNHRHTGTTGGGSVSELARSGIYEGSRSSHTHTYTSAYKDPVQSIAITTASNNAASGSSTAAVGSSGTSYSNTVASATDENTGTLESGGGGQTSPFTTAYVVTNFIIRSE